MVAKSSFIIFRCIDYKHKTNINGFTLLELLIVISVIGIFFAIALPAYTNQVTEKRQDEAKQKILEVMQKQNLYKSMTSPYQYTMDFTQLGYTSSSSVPSKSSNPNFNIVAAPCAPPLGSNLSHCIKLIAQPVNPSRDSTWELQSNEGDFNEIP